MPRRLAGVLVDALEADIGALRGDGREEVGCDSAADVAKLAGAAGVEDVVRETCGGAGC